MLNGNRHDSILFLFKELAPVHLIEISARDRADKYMLMRETARIVRQIGADAVFFVSETWTAKAENVPPGGFAVDATDRGEAIALHGANSGGEQIALSANVVRKKVKRHKVKSLSSTHVDTKSQNMMLAPFIEVWGRLDILMPRKGEEGFAPE